MAAANNISYVKELVDFFEQLGNLKAVGLSGLIFIVTLYILMRMQRENLKYQKVFFEEGYKSQSESAERIAASVDRLSESLATVKSDHKELKMLTDFKFNRHEDKFTELGNKVFKIEHHVEKIQEDLRL